MASKNQKYVDEVAVISKHETLSTYFFTLADIYFKRIRDVKSIDT
jgi:energy-converting hydrogenase Eha subunit C